MTRCVDIFSYPATHKIPWCQKHGDNGLEQLPCRDAQVSGAVHGGACALKLILDASGRENRDDHHHVELVLNFADAKVCLSTFEVLFPQGSEFELGRVN